jgi:hypothetical protein
MRMFKMMLGGRNQNIDENIGRLLMPKVSKLKRIKVKTFALQV